MTEFLGQITLGDIWLLQFMQGVVFLVAVGMIHGHQR